MFYISGRRKEEKVLLLHEDEMELDSRNICQKEAEERRVTNWGISQPQEGSRE